MASRAIGAGVLALGILTSPEARGQMGMPGGGRSLGGYGASTIGSYYGGGGGYVPYNGGTGLRSSPREGPGTFPVPRRPSSTPIGGASSGMGPGGMAGRSGRRGSGAEGMGSGGSVGMPMTGRGGVRRGTPGPGLGWPFAVPPGFPGSNSMGMP